MIKVISLDNSVEWDSIIESFNERDAYYFSSYAKAFMLHGDGEPLLFYYNQNNLRAVNVVMKRDIALCESFKDMLESGKYYDFATPYGYGGFILEGEYNEDLNIEYSKYCMDNNIISEFVRFHPVLKNSNKLNKMYEIINLCPTVTMDISDNNRIWQNISSKDRNVIKRSEKHGVSIFNGNSEELYNQFETMYNKTMDKNSASKYYYFNKKFYDSIRLDSSNYSTLFYAVYEGKIIAMSIILFANKGMHYHLSAFDMDYKKLAATNLLLYKAACWGNERGYQTMHLGGGVGCQEDSLYRFKSAFNKNSDTTFSIGRKIFNHNVYNDLVKLRNSNEISSSTFFPLYRA